MNQINLIKEWLISERGLGPHIDEVVTVYGGMKDRMKVRFYNNFLLEFNGPEVLILEYDDHGNITGTAIAMLDLRNPDFFDKLGSIIFKR